MSRLVWIPVLFAITTSSAFAETPVPRKLPATVAERVRPMDARARPMQSKVQATCTFLEISATTGKEPSIDPDLKHIQKKLNNPVWKFNQFKLLSRADKTLDKGKTEAITLKNGSATATLVEIVDKSGVRLTVTEDHGGKRVVNNTTTISAKDYLILSHPVPPSNDGHLLAVTCK